MDAQAKVLEYAKQHNSWTGQFTDEQLAGKMIAEGVVINRTSNSKTFARIARQGNEIIITERHK